MNINNKKIKERRSIHGVNFKVEFFTMHFYTNELWTLDNSFKSAQNRTGFFVFRAASTSVSL